jgi:rRNA maturation RNase YbeY
MISIKNTQRAISINRKGIEVIVQKILDQLEYPNFDIGILFTGTTTMRKYNRTYRGKDKPTDILSFPYHARIKAGKRIIAKTDEDRNLGDLILAPAYIKKDAAKYKQTFEERVIILLVHGICHLLGYDHETDTDYRIMHKKEQGLLKEFDIHLPLVID